MSEFGPADGGGTSLFEIDDRQKYTYSGVDTMTVDGSDLPQDSDKINVHLKVKVVDTNYSSTTIDVAGEYTSGEHDYVKIDGSFLEDRSSIANVARVGEQYAVMEIEIWPSPGGWYMSPKTNNALQNTALAGEVTNGNWPPQKVELTSGGKAVDAVVIITGLSLK